MAEALPELLALPPLLIRCEDNTGEIIEYNTHHDCVNYPKMFNYGWELLYKKYLTDLIKVLNVHSDASRLFLLIQFDISSLTDTLLRLSINKVTQFPEAVQLINNLKDIMPDACPIFLDIVAEMYAKSENCLSEYLELITTNKKHYPKLQEYNEVVKNLSIIKSLTVDFNVKDFLSMCPDPINYFKTTRVFPNSKYEKESLSYLCEKFPMISKMSLRAELTTVNSYNLSETVESLQNDPNPVYLKRKRQPKHSDTFKAPNNIEYLKEIAYLDHKEDILNYIDNEKTKHETKVLEAKMFGKLSTCQCCFSDEVLDSEIIYCPTGHCFCSSCIKRGVEIEVGSGKLEFKCFADCTEEFNLDDIKNIVDNKLYDRVMRLKQAQEVKAADIEGLETCAFCDYSVILSPDFKTINCQNPDCKKETCRLCRSEGHVPFKCDEIEKVTEVKVRTMIEDKMTEVLIRTCYNCKRKFVKEDGCNKMTCSCGKEMCYICRQPIASNYSHFYHTHMLENKCPLYTDENIVHATAVEAAARLIVNELKEKQPEMLRHIDIDKLLPSLQKNKTTPKYSSALDVNRVVATVTGQNIEDINNLKDMRSLEPRQKKARR